MKMLRCVFQSLNYRCCNLVLRSTSLSAIYVIHVTRDLCSRTYHFDQSPITLSHQG